MCTVLYQVALVCRAYDGRREGDRLTLLGLSAHASDAEPADGQKAGSSDHAECNPSTRDQSTRARTGNRARAKVGDNAEGRDHRSLVRGQTNPEFRTCARRRACNEVIQGIMRIVISHEDHINLLRLDRSFLLWMKTSSPETMLPNILAASRGWKELRESGSTETSLRVTLFPLHAGRAKVNRANNMVENEGVPEQACGIGLASGSGGQGAQLAFS